MANIVQRYYYATINSSLILVYNYVHACTCIVLVTNMQAYNQNIFL